MQGRNSHYFVNKRQRAIAAQLHTEEMTRDYSEEIQIATQYSHIFNNPSNDSFSRKYFTPMEGDTTTIEVVDSDSVSAIFKYCEYAEHPCVLNFASYTNPGGMFIKGSSAQEESLCHASYLYNILSNDRFKGYYEWNARHKNRGMYLNRAIYTPKVRFFDKGRVSGGTTVSLMCNVITCAAPNWSVSMKYGNFTEDENEKALEERINLVLRIAANYYTDVLILGAFGCGVFAQNPDTVASIFRWYLTHDYAGLFKHVIFAIPASNRDTNYQEFYQAFES